MRKVCKVVSLSPIGLFGSFCWIDFLLLTTTTLLFPQYWSSHTLCRAIDFFRSLKTCKISGATKSINSVPARFAVGTTYLRKNGIAVLPITSASAANPLPRCRPVLL